MVMEQLCFFPEAGQSKGLPPELLEYRPGLIDKQTGDALLAKFMKDTLEAVHPKNVGLGIPDTEANGLVRRCRHGLFSIR